MFNGIRKLFTPMVATANVQMDRQRFEVYVKRTQTGYFVKQEVAELVDVIECSSLEQANIEAKRQGGYAVAIV